MKILQLGKFFPANGGVEKVMVSLQEGISKKGFCCDMLCTNAKPGEPTRTIVVNDRASIFCVKAIAKKYATMISPQMITRLRSICNNYDIIHVHHPDPMAAVALMLSGYKGHVILHWHSDILKQKHLLKLYRPIQNWLIRRADVIVGTTPVYVEQSPDLAHARNKCIAIPLGINAVKPNMALADEIRKRYNGKKIIFGLGRLVHYKGFRYLVDAARYLPEDYVVLIGGSGELHDELQKQIDDSELKDRVFLLGRISDEELPGYFGACDLFCLSSIQKTEAFALVQVEAFSCGKPVVATRIPGSGVSWVDADGESGLTVPIEDSKALADAIARILSSDKLYKKLSEGAFNRFNSMFRLEDEIQSCLNLYYKIIGVEQDEH